MLSEPAWATAPVDRPADDERAAGGRRADEPDASEGARQLRARSSSASSATIPDPAGIVSFTKQRDGALGSEDHVTHRPRSVPRRPVRLRVPGQSQRRALRRADQCRRRRRQRRLGRHLGCGDASRRARLVRRDLDSGSDAGASSRVSTAGTSTSSAASSACRRPIAGRARAPDWTLTQTSRAGLLTGLPDFDLGLGLTVRPAVTGGGGIPAPMRASTATADASLDVRQRLRVRISRRPCSINTDFAETEVDARQTNLTRFPLFFPEKRTFFLEGSDIFQFGLGLGRRPDPVLQPPDRPGGRTGGADSRRRQDQRPRRRHEHRRARRATRERLTASRPATTLGAVRVKQNVFGESSVGRHRDDGRSDRPRAAAGSSDPTSRIRHRTFTATRTSASACRAR